VWLAAAKRWWLAAKLWAAGGGLLLKGGGWRLKFGGWLSAKMWGSKRRLTWLQQDGWRL